MDAYEASRMVFSRIQKLDPDNASRIMGLLLIQDQGDREMIRLAFGPESLLHSVIVKARKELGLSSTSPPTPSTPLSASPFFSRHASSRHLAGNIPPPLTIPNLSDLRTPDDLVSPNCYSSSALNSSSLPFYANGPTHHDVVDDLQLSFLNDASPTPDLYYPLPDLSLSPGNGGGGWGGSMHRRSCSVSDACLASDDPASGFGWKPCLYYAKGYCKNGSTCRFLHGEPAGVGSPSKHEMMERELLRSNSAHQHRLAAASQLMASAFPYSPKSINLLLQQNDTQRGMSRVERSEGMGSPASRQIYLTFPADSTFREEDVSNYFSIYGPVQDVRIPYQQKRMFGFVTFVYPDTVKLILAKGNPHFVCDARVLVKPYKEKPKLPDNCRKQQIDRGDFSPTGIDSFDLSSPGGGASMFYNNGQDMAWRRKMEEQAIELQSRRLMNLQLLDVKKHHHRALSTGSSIPSPTHSPTLFSPHHLVLPISFHANQQENRPGLTVIASHQQTGMSNGKESPIGGENSNGQESSLEHNLPDSPFASPTKASSHYFSAFSNGTCESETDTINSNSSPTLHPPSSLDMASFQSFNCQVSRLSSGHGAIGMFAGNGGSSFPVGI